jgi:Protein of unknown function (DUF1761)
MPDVSVPAILVATAAAFLVGGAYYAAFGEQLAGVSEAAAAAEQRPWQLAVEVGRCLVLAAVVAGLAAQGEIDEWSGGLALGLALWVGFPLVLWVGAVVHEKVPVKLAAIHGGDWLAKLLAVGVLVGVVGA